jgi:hypothetical protein
MEMSQLRLLLTLPQGKQILLHNKWEIAWVQETVWKLWRREKFLHPPTNFWVIQTIS